MPATAANINNDSLNDRTLFSQVLVVLFHPIS